MLNKIRQLKIITRLIITYILAGLILLGATAGMTYQTTIVKNIIEQEIQQSHIEKTQFSEKTQVLGKQLISFLNKFMTVWIVFLFMIILCSFVMFYLIFQELVIPLQQAFVVTDHMSKGSFDYELKVKTMDEMGELLQSIKIIRIIFRSVFSQILEVSNKFFNSAKFLREFSDEFAEASEKIAANARISSSRLTELSDATSVLADSVSKETERIKEIRNSIVLLNDSTVNIAHLFKELSAVSSRSAAQANSGKVKIEEVKVAMEEIGKNSKAIKDIMGLINDISEQTNLLALNASIEAARAGAAGKGFSVVAAEVSRLADNTADRVKEIEKLIKTTNQAVNNGTSKVDEAGRTMDAILESSSLVDKYIDKVQEKVNIQSEKTALIQTHIEKMTEIAIQIEDSIIGQKNTAHEVDEAVKMVSEETMSLSESSKKIIVIAKDKVRTSNFLQTIANEFKIDSKYLIQWDDTLSVNVDELNEQHKKLIEILNLLYTSTHENKSREVLTEILNSLIQYTVVHFETEEKLMAKTKYPGMEEHIREHELLKQQVLSYNSQYQSESETVSFELLNFLRKWLTNHILRSDKKYSKHFNQAGIY
ncbi:MAG TPA: bacteriohemerythrin [Leptospiraceae bacterium]|nr:bacteriohemerythrin [Leptospiraceae bacterium]HMY67342.1 bacteriohemerythrin [Leptospiraceae bacterium]HMZ57153.1 bacteriohemerythrin [Leptospiraceae bacterium]HNF24530.1 bacteriohemerythrin [Leptospiraceae bacterium]HNI98750.1 bacteriohemerythrin [Leptospiraceae bacterium]